MQRQQTLPYRPKLSIADRRAKRRKAHIALYKGALLNVLLALLYRLLAYHACNYLRDQKPDIAQTVFPLIKKPLSYIQFALSFAALVSDRVRRYNPSLLLVLLALTYGISGALPEQNASVNSLSHKPLLLEEDADSPIKFSISVDGLSPEEFLQVSLNTQPTMYLAIPAASALALALPIPGSFLISTSLAGVLPYAMTKVYTLAEGWDRVSWAATIGSTLSGIFSFWGAYFLLSTTWKLSSGYSMTGFTIQLNDQATGRDPRDHAYVAAWTMLHFLLAPLWLLIFAVRTWLWVLSCGIAFNGKAAALASKAKTE